MSYNSVTLHNPEINEDSQLARRTAEGIEDIYFRHTSGDITRGDDHPDQVDLTDEVTRRVDPTKLPLDKIEEHESYKEVGGKNYLVSYEDVGGGNRVPYLREVLGRRHYSDTKMALIGGKVYEIEFEKDPETKRISTYLTTPVGDLFQNDKFLAGQNPAQKLELLGKIRKSATYVTWYDSGEYNRYSRTKYEGEENPELDPSKVKDYSFDEGAMKLNRDLEKAVGVPAPSNAPLPQNISEVGVAVAATACIGLGLSLYSGGFAAGQARGGSGSTAVPEAHAQAPVQKLYHKSSRYAPKRQEMASSSDSPRNRRRYN